MFFIRFKFYISDFMPLSLIGLNLNLIWLIAVEINRKLIQIEPDQINQLIETSGIEVEVR